MVGPTWTPPIILTIPSLYPISLPLLSSGAAGRSGDDRSGAGKERRQPNCGGQGAEAARVGRGGAGRAPGSDGPRTRDLPRRRGDPWVPRRRVAEPEHDGARARRRIGDEGAHDGAVRVEEGEAPRSGGRPLTSLVTVEKRGDGEMKKEERGGRRGGVRMTWTKIRLDDKYKDLKFSMAHYARKLQKKRSGRDQSDRQLPVALNSFFGWK
uniref:Uncharacterized protein n=1 Tax=Oryza glaberrima TaxID=4538 RepID=I1P9M9_ORYGL